MTWTSNDLMCFRRLAAGANELDRKAEAYMADKEFIPNDEVKYRIWRASCALFHKHGGTCDKDDYMRFCDLDWDALPWWAAQTLDSTIPYGEVPRNGSLGFSLGYSAASQDAHLRNIMEIAEGREQHELDFPVVFKLKEEKS